MTDQHPPPHALFFRWGKIQIGAGHGAAGVLVALALALAVVRVVPLIGKGQLYDIAT